MPSPHSEPTAAAPRPLPMSREEMRGRGWTELDVLLVTGDAYVDHPSFGVALIGRVLEADGWRVGILAQPDWRNPACLEALGRPRLFAGISAGNLDSMLSNYTAARHRRREDDYSPGGRPGLRPNHACAVYAQLVRRAFPGLPVVLGGIEASLRRVAHYDYWEDKLRPSILADSKADLLVYGMGESAIREIARRLAAASPSGAPADLAGLPGTARLLGAAESAPYGEAIADEAAGDSGFVRLPSWEELQATPRLLLEQTRQVEAEQNPFCGRRLVQFHGRRALLVAPPAPPLAAAGLDRLYELPFTRRPHPSYHDEIPAFTMIRDSVTAVRGCPGGCTFCGLGLHQGKFLQSRSRDSVLRELRTLAAAPGFRGTVTDLGGPTANLHGSRNGHTAACRSCRRPSCLFPEICPKLEIAETAFLELLRQGRRLPGIRHLFVQSGIRMDVILRQPELLRELVRHHVSGHLKVAPEHLHPEVLRRMRKPGPAVFEAFLDRFGAESRAAGKEQYTVPYFIASFPGCTAGHMGTVEEFLRRSRWNLQQVQDFIPLPMTPAAAMYVTGLDYESGQPIPVARGTAERQRQLASLRPTAAGRRGKTA
ncbi:MAG: YgiQ family radical SAM protein [Lentisphaeria bacterium]